MLIVFFPFNGELVIVSVASELTSILLNLFDRNWKLRWQQVANSIRLTAINFDPKMRPRRQDWPGELVETGMFYFIRRELIAYQGLLQNDRFKIIIIVFI